MRYYFILTFAFLNIFGNAQELPFDIQIPKINEYINFEKKQGVDLCLPISNNQTSVGEKHAVKFTKNDLALNDYESTYIFNKVDSTIISINQSWKIKNSNSTWSEKNLKLRSALIAKYEDFKMRIENRFGKGIDNSVEETIILDGSDHGRIKNSFGKIFLWKVDENISIILDAYTSALYQKGGYSTHPSFNHLTLNIIDNSKNDDALSVKKLNMNALLFFKKIKNNLNESKKYLSPLIYENEKNKFVEATIETTGRKPKLKLISNSYEKAVFGTFRGCILRYRYLKPIKDKDLRITFDQSGRIFSIFEVSAQK